MSKLASSYASVGVVGLAITALHAVWLARTSHAGEVISGFGSALVVIGVWVAAFPLIRRGLQRVGPLLSDYAVPSDPDLRAFSARILAEQEREKVRRDQIDERVFGVALALVGTLLNGYAAPLARVIGLEP